MHGGDIYSNPIDLDFSVSINPLPTPESVRMALRRGLEYASGYPDIDQREVRSALAQSDGIDPGCVIAGSGASELILGLVRLLHPRRVYMPSPGFTGYRHAVNALRDCEMVSIPGSADLIIIDDPNNPTGANLGEERLLDILRMAENSGASVLLDESFYPLSEASWTAPDRAGLIGRYPDLYIVRSFTKSFALPGIRMGYVIASPDHISGLKKHLPEWNLSSVAASAMVACAEEMRDGGYIRESMELIHREREYLTGELRSFTDQVYDSDTVFIMFRSFPELADRLISRRILIRELSDVMDGEKGYFRIGIRTHEENEILIDNMRSIVK